MPPSPEDSRLGPHVVGRRVVVRYRLVGRTGPSGGPAMTDVLGTCTAWGDGRCSVRTADGRDVEVALADIVAGKPVPPAPLQRGERRDLDTPDLGGTWWGHASTTVELGGQQVSLDPVLSERLLHLRRTGPTPGPEAARADLVLVSHLHSDHLHVPSLRRYAGEVPLVVPRGGEPLLRGVGADRVIGVVPGDVLDLDGLRIEVLPARHDDRRSPNSQLRAQPVGFRVSGAAGSFWYPGDTGLTEEMADIAPVDLAVVPIGGWGPTLGDLHLDPRQAATAVARVGAGWALPVHWGTFWPIGLTVLARKAHRRLFVEPGQRFLAALGESAPATQPLLIAPGERFRL